MSNRQPGRPAPPLQLPEGKRITLNVNLQGRSDRQATVTLPTDATDSEMLLAIEGLMIVWKQVKRAQQGLPPELPHIELPNVVPDEVARKLEQN